MGMKGLLLAALLASACSGDRSVEPNDAFDAVEIADAADISDPDTAPPADVPPPSDEGEHPLDPGPAVDHDCPVAAVTAPLDGDVVFSTLNLALTVTDETGIESVTVKDSATGEILLDFEVWEPAPTTLELSGAIDVCRYGTGDVIFALNLRDTLGNGCNRQVKPFVVRCPRFEGDGAALESARGATVADLDSDGDPDVIAATDDGVVLLPGRGELRLGPPRSLLPLPARFVIADDLDLDGDVDLIVAHEATVRVALSGLDGFDVVEEHTLPAGVTAMAWADVAPDVDPENGNANLADLVFGTADPDHALLVLIREEGAHLADDGSQVPLCQANEPSCFSAPISTPGGPVLALKVADLIDEEGGALDLATLTGATLEVFAGSGTGAFASPVVTELPEPGTALLVESGDALVALSDHVLRLPGQGDGAFDLLNTSVQCVEGSPSALGRVGGRLVVGNAATDSLWQRNGDTWHVLGSVPDPERILETDLDGDGEADAVIVGGGRVGVIGGSAKTKLLAGRTHLTSPIPPPLEGSCSPRRRPELSVLASGAVVTVSEPDGSARLLDTHGEPAGGVDQLLSESLIALPGAAVRVITGRFDPGETDDLALATDSGVVLILGGDGFTAGALHESATLDLAPLHCTNLNDVLTDLAILEEGALTVLQTLPAGGFEVASTVALPDDDWIAVTATDQEIAVHSASQRLLFPALPGCVLGEPEAADPALDLEAHHADVNGDGIDDEIRLESGEIRVRVGLPDGGLWPDPVTIRTAPGVTGFHTADLDGDGCLDLVTLSPEARAATVHRSAWATSPKGCD